MANVHYIADSASNPALQPVSDGHPPRPPASALLVLMPVRRRSLYMSRKLPLPLGAN